MRLVIYAAAVAARVTSMRERRLKPSSRAARKPAMAETGSPVEVKMAGTVMVPNTAKGM